MATRDMLRPGAAPRPTVRTRRSCVLALALAAAGAHAQPQQVLFAGVEGQALLDSIRAVYAPAQTLGYDVARDSMLARLQRVAGQVSCVYTGHSIVLTPGADPSTSAFQQGINTEHTWPQSMGTSVEPSRSDMHHLFPVREDVNSARGNHPFGEIPDELTDAWYRHDVVQSTVPTMAIDEWSERDAPHPEALFTARFEPREDHSGDAARAAFYIRAMYPDRVAAAGADDFFEVQRPDLLAWTYADPVGPAEYARSEWIAGLQGSPNPFVLDSTLGRRAFGERIDAGGGPAPAYAATVWVNELHYDNEGTDAGEFIELAIPEEIEPELVTVTLYNGNGGAAYDSRTAAAGVVGASIAGFTLHTLDYAPPVPIQNGAPDGIAIAVEGEVVLFLSYEGTFTAADGPAAGLSSLDIGVSESGNTPAGYAVSLRGAANTYAGFTWAPPSPASPGAVNAGQTFVPTGGETPPTAAVASLRLAGPNPVRASTRLDVVLEHASHARLEVFDILGRRVALLHDAPLPAGRRTFTWDATEAPAGPYVARLTADRGIEHAVLTRVR